tara:strand:- start:705 stop:1229 length:525 start_codon:yes stop_codon:yes gene_type:complete
MCQSALKYILVGQAPAAACRTCGLTALTRRAAESHRPRLGVTDLEEDEALLVWLCRRWYHGRTDRAQIEAELAGDMSRDAYAGVLLYLFALLAELPDPQTQAKPGWPLLSDHEMHLLDLLARGRPLVWMPELGSCLDALHAAGIRIRPCRHIVASGRDDLTARIDYAHPMARVG